VSTNVIINFKCMGVFAVLGTHYGWRTHSQHSQVPLDGSLTLHCYARGSDIQWRHNDKAIISNGTLLDHGSEKFHYTCSYPQSYWCNLTIIRAQFGDHGHYRCNSSYFKWTYDTFVSVLSKPLPLMILFYDQ